MTTEEILAIREMAHTLMCNYFRMPSDAKEDALRDIMRIIAKLNAQYDKGGDNGTTA